MYAGFGAAEVTTIRFPACYSKEFDACLEDPFTTDKDCKSIQAAWRLEDERIDKAIDDKIDAMPFCSSREKYYWAGGGILAGIFVGSLLATVMM